jgi:prepilin-type processing-associated H-X9-DG protein
LVVIAIIGMLIALLLPAIQAAREAARRMQCGNNLKQIGLGLHNYHDAKGHFPPGANGSEKYANYPKAKENVADRTTWTFLIYPFIEQQSLFDLYQGKLTSTYYNGVCYDTATMERPGAVSISAYQCASDPMTTRSVIAGTPNDARGNYAGFCAPHAYWNMIEYINNSQWKSRHRAHFFCIGGPVTHATYRTGPQPTDTAAITDGLSNTIAVGEMIKGSGFLNDYRGCIFWENAPGAFLMTYYPPNTKEPDTIYKGYYNAKMDLPKAPTTPIPANWPNDQQAWSRSYHNGGVNVLFGDGSCRFATENVDPHIWRALGTIDNAGGREYDPDISTVPEHDSVPAEPSSVSL